MTRGLPSIPGFAFREEAQPFYDDARRHGSKEGQMFADLWKSVKDPELRLAWAIAVAADALQIGAFPLFAEGAISPLDSVLDLVVAFMLIRLVGWHWAFLPTIVAEALPGADLFPTWTAALLFVSHDRSRSSEPEVLEPEPVFGQH